MSCGHCFRGGHKLTEDEVWNMYLNSKQTAAEISTKTGVSPSTVKRILSRITFEWKQPNMTGKGVIHLDATYFGRNTGVLLALESQTGRLLYMKHIAHEHISDYVDAVSHILSSGYEIKE